MATNDGYNPYPIGLSAVDTVAALNRAHTAKDIFINYTTQSVLPVEIQHNGDIWHDSDTGKMYSGYYQDNVLVWMEV